MATARRPPLVINGQRLRLGSTTDLALKISETSLGTEVTIPVRVIRARKHGPTIFISGAVHGDEVNGTGIIRHLSRQDPPQLKNGTLICVPVVNIYGFERQERYMPDRRDLNRSFPGSSGGPLASRFAHRLFDEIVRHCDFGIDLHSAAQQRTNYPNVRGDINNPGVRRLAEAFGCELIVHGKGPEGSLRRTATDKGCPTIILEAGEINKIEPTVLEVGARGIHNVLRDLGMVGGEPVRPLYQTVIRKTTWVRAELGGLLRFHVSVGDLVEAGQPLATNESLFGDAHSVLIAPRDGVVLGMATNPAVMPGEPVCHLALPRVRLRTIRRALHRASQTVIEHRLRQDLATNVRVDAHDEGG